MSNTITLSPEGVTAEAFLRSRDEADKYRDQLALVCEAAWPTPDEPVAPKVKRKNSTAGWTPERRAAQAERMRARMNKRNGSRAA